MKQKNTQKQKRSLPPWTLLTPYGLIFAIFIIIPVVAAVVLSFTYFNTIQPPELIGLQNYIDLFTTTYAAGSTGSPHKRITACSSPA